MKKIYSLILFALLALTSLKPLAVQAQALDSREEASIYPVSYQLNAMDPHSLAQFYQEAMGMTTLEAEDEYYRLGTSEGDTLLELFPASIPHGQTLTTGIYHVAYLYQDRHYLGSHLTHLFNQETPPLEGFTHHIVSDAIYAADPEGNGIELYWDYPPEDWEYAEDGDIVMGNEPLNFMELMNASDLDFEGMNEGVRIGHFHIVSDDIDAAGDFYQTIFGLEDMTYLEDDSRFQSSGTYHHHIGINEWFADSISGQPEDGKQGLRAMVWETQSAEVYQDVLDKLTAEGVEYTEETSEIFFKDASGLSVILQLAQD